MPTVTITTNTPHGETHNSGTISYTVTFSEDVTGFDTSDIEITGTANGGSFDVLSLTPMSGPIYTFDVEIISDGTVSVFVDANTAADLGGNGNAASNTHTVTVVIPSVEILSAVWRDPDESDTDLSDGDELIITFNQDTDMAGSLMLSKFELDAVFVFERSLGANYTGAWSNARTLVITIVDSTDADAVIGDTISPFRGTAFIRSLDTAGGAAFSNPNSVGTNSTGHVFVGDTFIPLPTEDDDINSRVQIFHPDGSYAGVPDTTGGAAFSRPAGIATNSTGYTFIADHGSDLVQIFDPSGVYAGALVTATDGLTFREPAGVAIGKDDMIYVSDTNDSNTNERDRRIVQIFDQDGTYAGVLATTVNTEFDVPISVATNSSGHVFVADSGNDNIRIFNPTGEENTSNIDTTGPAGSALRAVATNSTDHLFVVYNNAGVDTVQVYTASGVYAGEQSFGDDVSLGTISGIAVGSDDKIIVSERSNNDMHSKDAVHIFGHQVLYSDTGLRQFESADAITEGNFGELRATVSISSDDVADGDTTGLGTIHFTAEFSEAVTGFVETSDITVDGTAAATVTTLTGISDTMYTFDVDVTAAGTLTVSILAGAALDFDTRDNAASDVYTVTVIDTMPVVTAVSAVNGGAYMAGETIDITVTFDDAVTVDGTPQLTLETGVDDDDDAVVDYSFGTGTTELVFPYTVGATHNSNDLNYVDTGSLKLNGGTIVARDYNNPASLALPAVDSDESLGGSSDVIVDTLAPTSPSAATTVDSNGIVDIVFNEAVKGTLHRDQFTVTGSSVFDSKIVDENIRLGLGNVLVTTSHMVSYDGKGSITDAAGNPVALFGPLLITNNQFETVRPVPVITSDTVSDGGTTISRIINYSVNFGEFVDDFTKSVIVLSGDASTDATVTAPTEAVVTTPAGITFTEYTFTVTATMGGTLTVFIPVNSVTDIFGNQNILSDTYTVIINPMLPRYDSSETTDASTITITADRPLMGIADADDFTVSVNAISDNPVSEVTVSGSTIILKVETPITSVDTLTVSYTDKIIDNNIITDVAGNALEMFSLEDVDNTPLSALPLAVTVTSSVPNGATIIGDTVSYTVTFNKVVADFDVNDITVSGTASGGMLAASDFNSESGVRYTFTVTAPTPNGTITVSVLAGVATDALDNTNTNTASNTYTVTVDINAPIATFVNSIGGPNAGGGNSQFQNPYGITVSSTQILVAEFANSRMQAFDLDGNFIRTFGGLGGDNGKFKQPHSTTTNSTHILVADTENNRIQVFDLDGNFVSKFGVAGDGDGYFNNPRGITTNSTHILVADTFNSRIQVFDLDGNFVSKFGRVGFIEGQLRYPTGITTNSTHILVVESLNHRVSVFDLDGNFVSTFGDFGAGDGLFYSPVGIATTPTHILVTEVVNNRVQVFDFDGNYVSKFGDSGSGNDQFNEPHEITTNSTHVLVTDALNHRIQIFDLAPTVAITADTPDGLIHNSNTVSYTAVFAGAVTGFDMTDINVSGTASVGSPAARNFAGSGDTYTFDVAATSDGTITVAIPKLAARDTSDNPNLPSAAYSVTVSDDAPVIDSVFATSRLYSEGDTVAITVRFNEAVDVTEPPQLLLETGTNNAVAGYSSGTGTTDIVFSYTVAATHDSADLNYVGTGSLSLNGGSIVAINGGASASLTLPATTSANSLGGSSDVMVNTSPTVIITSDIPDGSITTSTTISYIVTFREDVTGFDTSDIVITGTANDGSFDVLSLTPMSGSIYTFEVEITSDGTVSVFVDENHRSYPDK